MYFISCAGVLLSIFIIVFAAGKITKARNLQNHYLEAWDKNLQQSNNLQNLDSNAANKESKPEVKVEQSFAKENSTSAAEEDVEVKEELEDIVCVINFQRLNKRVPILKGITNSILDKSAGWSESTAVPGEIGNSQIFGHRDTSFNLLKNVKVGDTFFVETNDGKRQFIIYDTKVVMPEEVRPPDVSRAATLQLITCYPFQYIGSAPKRFVVYAKAE